MNAEKTLRRSLGTTLLVFHGLGVIIGAGIYVLVGSVIATAGPAAPLSFVLAGVVAGLTGLTYSELSTRFPEAGGSAIYVKEAFRSNGLSQLVGLALAAVVVTSAASIAKGSASYLSLFGSWPDELIAGGVVGLFTLVACLKVRESVRLAAAMTLIEISGLLYVIIVGWPGAEIMWRRSPEMLWAFDVSLIDVGEGAFLAFFAFIGFETIANMAEEARTPRYSMPRAILAILEVSSLLYVAVAAIAVLAVPGDQYTASSSPLLAVVRGSDGWVSPEVFAVIAVLSIANGVLIELIMLGRLLYGMARHTLLPTFLTGVSARSQVPAAATLTGGLMTAALAVLVPISALIQVANFLILLVFLMVNLSLWRLHHVSRFHDGFHVPRIIPPAAAASTLLLMLGVLI